MTKRELEVTEALIIPAAELRYEYARSGGPGGQHVNTTDTRVRLRFSVRSAVLSEEVQARLRSQNRAWLSDEDELVISSDSHRSRHRNIDEVRERLAAAIRAALARPKKRRPTKRTKGSHERRLGDKKRRGDLKAGRKQLE